ncbi:ABC transporter permease [Candidatus Uabimicrobium amorphum]|uniref:ABC3 transporter permease C-terminal domain-containing protein n=1 Tax=Uabimicrobium amorphum TaxID=2596890 RepID=A0A5S9IQC7_UABAM|nr:ABC transporter permease [Candidatus Uabimicrobium amorphum]BBM85220.1 hypothetical protein UABAM_03583 [Candidatus Uabimicrobium amorphum]
MVIRSLDKKLLRDMAKMKWQCVAISLVLACGIAMFVMSISTRKSLIQTQKIYYDNYGFAHIFSNVKRAPLSLQKRIAKIPGIVKVQSEIVVDVTLDFAEAKEPCIGRFITIGNGPHRKLYLRKGRFVNPNSNSEVMISESFFNARNFKLGDHVVALFNGHKKKLKIVGVVLCPEYILEIRPGDLFPDQKHFGVFWIKYNELAAAFDMQGAFNTINIYLMKNSSTKKVITMVDRLLKPYGGSGAYDRSEQISNRYVSEEINQLANMAKVAPTIFLLVSIFLLYVVFTRLISAQREQIAILKAFGYRHREVGIHYFKFACLITIPGLIFGTFLGVMLGRNLTRMYTKFYHFPIFHFSLDVEVIIYAILISLFTAFFGVFRVVRRAIKLPAAEAMRPEPPPIYKPTFFERAGLSKFLSQRERMVMRHLERNLGKSCFASLGIAMSVSILVLSGFMSDAISYVIETEFHLAKRHDISLIFNEPTSHFVKNSVAKLPGVLYQESFRSVATHLHAKHRSRRLAIMGLQQNSRLYYLLDMHRKRIHLPTKGLLVSKMLAELMQLRVGDFVTIEVLSGQRPICQVQICGIINDFSGLNAYMEKNALHHLLREGSCASGIFATIDSSRKAQLYTKVKSLPHVASVSIKSSLVENFKKTLAENLLVMKMMNVIFAVIIAFGVVYNTVRISLAEKSRDFATLRVLGFTHSEVSGILLGELAVVTLVALPIGIAIGYALVMLSVVGLASEIFRVPPIIYGSTYAFAIIIVITATIISGFFVRKKLYKLDLISVLKTRE